MLIALCGRLCVLFMFNIICGMYVAVPCVIGCVAVMCGRCVVWSGLRQSVCPCVCLYVRVFVVDQELLHSHCYFSTDYCIELKRWTDRDYVADYSRRYQLPFTPVRTFFLPSSPCQPLCLSQVSHVCILCAHTFCASSVHMLPVHPFMHPSQDHFNAFFIYTFHFHPCVFLSASFVCDDFCMYPFCM